MNQINDSIPNDPTMAASTAFNTILDQIRRSNLNFQMHLSPFSANISLKSSLIRDKSGSPLLPPAPLILYNDVKSENMEILIATNKKLENDLSVLQNKFEETLAENKVIHSELENLKENLSGQQNAIQNEIKEKKKIKKLRQKARIKVEKVASTNSDIEGIKVFNRESPHTGAIKFSESASAKPPCSPTSSRTPLGTPPPPSSSSQASHPPDQPTCWPSPTIRGTFPCSSPHGTSSAVSPGATEAETETVLFEGRLISKQDALKKILEAVQDVNKNFSPVNS